MHAIRRGWMSLALCAGFMIGLSSAGEKTETPTDRMAAQPQVEPERPPSGTEDGELATRIGAIRVTRVDANSVRLTRLGRATGPVSKVIVTGIQKLQDPDVVYASAFEKAINAAIANVKVWTGESVSVSAPGTCNTDSTTEFYPNGYVSEVTQVTTCGHYLPPELARPPGRTRARELVTRAGTIRVTRVDANTVKLGPRGRVTGPVSQVIRVYPD